MKREKTTVERRGLAQCYSALSKQFDLFKAQKTNHPTPLHTSHHPADSNHPNWSDRPHFHSYTYSNQHTLLAATRDLESSDIIRPLNEIHE